MSSQSDRTDYILAGNIIIVLYAVSKRSAAVRAGASPKGDRVLCLDGGGIKYLVLIESLATVERICGRAGLSIPEALGKLSIGGPLPT